MSVFKERRQDLRPARGPTTRWAWSTTASCSPRPASTRTTRRRPGPRSATAAKKIAALGNGFVGFGEYSAGNTGGWHFTAELYAQGGDDGHDGRQDQAAFNSAEGKAVLENLKDMRWTDNSMGSQAAARAGTT